MYLIDTFFVARHAPTGGRKNWVHAPLTSNAAARTHTRLIVVDSTIDVGLLHPRNHFREGVLSVHLRRLGVGVVTRKTCLRARVIARRLRTDGGAPVPRPARGWRRRWWRRIRAARFERDAIADRVGVCHRSTRGCGGWVGVGVVRPNRRVRNALNHDRWVVRRFQTSRGLRVRVYVKRKRRRLHVAL